MNLSDLILKYYFVNFLLLNIFLRILSNKELNLKIYVILFYFLILKYYFKFNIYFPKHFLEIFHFT
jgi:hypothetical protein